MATVDSIVFGFLLIWGLVSGVSGETSAHLQTGVYIVVVFLLAATAPKAVQKFAGARRPTRPEQRGGFLSSRTRVRSKQGVR